MALALPVTMLQERSWSIVKNRAPGISEQLCKADALQGMLLREVGTQAQLQLFRIGLTIGPEQFIASEEFEKVRGFPLLTACSSLLF